MTTIFIGCDNSKSEIELLMESMTQKALLVDAGTAEYLKLNTEMQAMIQNQANSPTDTQEKLEKKMGEMKVFNEKMQEFKVCMDVLNAEIKTDSEKLEKLMEEKTIDDVSKKEMMKAAMAFASGLTENVSFEEYCKNK
jgi:actin-related protein